MLYMLAQCIFIMSYSCTKCYTCYRKHNEPTTNTTTINVQPSPGKQQSSSISQLVIKKTPVQQVPALTCHQIEILNDTVPVELIFFVCVENFSVFFFFKENNLYKIS